MTAVRSRFEMGCVVGRVARSPTSHMQQLNKIAGHFRVSHIILTNPLVRDFRRTYQIVVPALLPPFAARVVPAYPTGVFRIRGVFYDAPARSAGILYDIWPGIL